MQDKVTWKWYHDGGSPLQGEYVEGNTIRVLEIDKDFELGETLDAIEEFNLAAYGS